MFLPYAFELYKQLCTGYRLQSLRGPWTQGRSTDTLSEVLGSAILVDVETIFQARAHL